jgi:FtsP/CotA-like multicopper oxidase with cupredoxin domain
MNSRTASVTVTDDTFTRDSTGLPVAVGTGVVALGDGSRYDLAAGPVRKRIGDAEVRMLAYNGSVPGPTLRVEQGSTVMVNFTNRTDMEATVHCHGVRLDNRFDGTHHTQPPVETGESFTYEVTFPDPGAYWYHPHIREDYGQELGLYGTILVVPAESDYWPPAHREILLTLDDILIEDGMVAAFSPAQTTHTAMGRFGNVMLVNGETALSLAAHHDEVVRFYLTNTANTRVFNVGFDGARMKLVGGDSGHCEHEAFVECVVLAPSERVVVDVLFDHPGAVTLRHHTPDRRYALGTVTVSPEPAMPSLADAFSILRANPDMEAERGRVAQYLDAPPDKTLAFVAEMDLGMPDGEEPVVYACPMHPDVVQDGPGQCPICGMKLLAQAAPPPTYTCPMHPEVVRQEAGSCPICGMKLLPSTLVAELSGGSEDHTAHQHDKQGSEEHTHHGHATSDGVEWEDDMVEVNRMTTPANMRWLLVDRQTGAGNHDIDWHFRVGDQVKIRLVNEMDSDHPMHHPFHIHGAGRFLVLARDGVTEPNLMWKDTVLVRTGETVDILLDVTNPGVWMAHCHIAEHHESGMMLIFHVTE